MDFPFFKNITLEKYITTNKTVNKYYKKVWKRERKPARMISSIIYCELKG